MISWIFFSLKKKWLVLSDSSFPLLRNKFNISEISKTESQQPLKHWCYGQKFQCRVIRDTNIGTCGSHRWLSEQSSHSINVLRSVINHRTLVLPSCQSVPQTSWGRTSVPTDLIQFGGSWGISCLWGCSREGVHRGENSWHGWLS